MELKFIITILGGFISSIVTGWVSWFFTRRKYNTEVDQTQIENMKKSLEFYMTLSNDNRDRLQEILKQNEELTQQVQLLRKQVMDLSSLIHKELGDKFNIEEYINTVDEQNEDKAK